MELGGLAGSFAPNPVFILCEVHMISVAGSAEWKEHRKGKMASAFSEQDKMKLTTPAEG